MSTTRTSCTTCARPLDADDDRCPTCGALASPAVDETTWLDADDPTVATDAPPWSIPIREPRAAAPPLDERRSPGRIVGLSLLAAVAVLVTVVLGGLFGGDDGDAEAGSGGPAPSGPVRTDESAGIAAETVRPESTTTASTTAPTTTAVEATTTTTTAPRPAASPTTAATVRTAPNGTGSVPALSTSFRGWVAQLRSVPFDAGTARLREEWERTRATAPGVVATRSNDWSAFGDGFWVLLDPGPFRSADAVRDFCSSLGLDGDGECLPRELRG